MIPEWEGLTQLAGRAKKRVGRFVKKRRRILRMLFWFGVGCLTTAAVLGMVGYTVYYFVFWGRVVPHVSVGEVEVSGLAQSELEQKLTDVFAAFTQQHPEVVISFEDRAWEIPVAELALDMDLEVTVQRALAIGRTGSPFQQLQEQWQVFRNGDALPFVVAYDQTPIEQLMATVAAQVDVPMVPTSLELVDSTASGSAVAVHAGKVGRMVNAEQLQELIELKLRWLQQPTVELPFQTLAEHFSAEQLVVAQRRAEQFVGKKLQVEFTYHSDQREFFWTVADEELVRWVAIGGGYNKEAIADYVDGLAAEVDRPAQNALFQFDPTTLRATAFRPGIDGLTLDTNAAQETLITSLEQLEAGQEPQTVSLQAVATKPNVTTDSVNELGIRQLLGRGVSTFRGSIPSRIHNLALAASRINGILVVPGETFSYNEALGEVSLETGFEQAYVISDGRTVLGDGGGVCQDSTTLFRAVLDAGLPVVEWRYHSYRVGYYEQNERPGFDATVYAPTTDFKFKNDTLTHILIQALVSGTTLTIELYGTNDGRVATISNYALWDETPPPPDLYQDDPTLPVGTVKQVDWKAWGAKTKFDYTVTRGDETLFSKTFYSVFKPWQAVFLQGTGGV